MSQSPSPRSRWPAVRLAPRGWRPLWYAAAFLPALLIWWQAANPFGPMGYDFASYAAAAHMVALGHDPYHRLLAEYPGLRGGSGATVSGNGYVYPPLLAVVLAVPLRLGLGEGALWLPWCVVALAAAVWMAHELSRVLLPARVIWTGAALFAVLMLLAAVARYDLALGQTDVLLAALAVGAQGLRLRGRVWLAALALGAAIAIKPMLAPLLLVWLWKGDRRAFALGAACAGVLLLAPFALVGGLAPLREYATFFGAWGAVRGNADFINQSAYGLLLRTLTVNPYTRPIVAAPGLVLPLRAAITLGAGLVWIAAVPWRSGAARIAAAKNAGAAARTDETAHALGEKLLGEYLLALPLLLVASPLSEDIHFCLLLPALIGLIWLARLRGGWRRPAAIALWATLALCCVPRMQELIYPTRFVLLPGQSDPRLGPLIVLLRTNLLLIAAVATLVAGQAVLRRGGTQGDNGDRGTEVPAHDGRTKVQETTGA